MLGIAVVAVALVGVAALTRRYVAPQADGLGGSPRGATVKPKGFDSVDLIILMVSFALGLLVSAPKLRALIVEFEHVATVMTAPPVLRDRHLDDIWMDRDLAWLLRDWKGRPVVVGDLPGVVTPKWALFAAKGPGLAWRIALITSSMWPTLVGLICGILASRLRRVDLPVHRLSVTPFVHRRPPDPDA
jgi:hypothetical protein